MAAISDGFPVTLGHTLIISRRHVPSYFDLTAVECSDLWSLLDMVKAFLTERFNPDGYNVGFNDGPAAGQTIAHMHLHVIPRRVGDVDDPRGGIRWVIPAQAKYWDEGLP
jgi:diadenosine tetraphosphate (Ap4A) HIT family hydrolase